MSDDEAYEIRQLAPPYSAYYISNMGEVFSLKRYKLTDEPVEYKGLQLYEHRGGRSRGRRSVMLYPPHTEGKPPRHRKTFTIHHLVLTTFKGPSPGAGYCCRHLNGDAEDNRAVNLQWGTYQENSDDQILHGTTTKGEKSHHAKLTDADVIEIRKMLARGAQSKEIMARFNIVKSTLSYIRNGKTWTHLL